MSVAAAGGRRSPLPDRGEGQRLTLAGIAFDRISEAQVIEHVIEAARHGRGGWVCPVNIDVCRLAAQDADLGSVIGGASFVVPDGMPLLWAARLRGERLAERVAGASLIFSLSGAAARNGLSVYLLGGAAGVPQQAAGELTRRYPGLVIAGTDAPPLGFDASADGVEAVRARLTAAAPDIVFVGLGCPKQERLIARVAPALPAAWFIACGGAIPFAAGLQRRAPLWLREAGLSWLFRLVTEPRRLFRRYLVHDAPFAWRLLVSSAGQRIRRRGGK